MCWQTVCKTEACAGVTFMTVSGLPLPEQATAAGLSAQVQSLPSYLTLILHLLHTNCSCLFCPYCIIPKQNETFL